LVQEPIPTQVMRVTEFCKAARMSKSAVYKALHNGAIPFVRLAGQIRIPAAVIAGLVASALKEAEERRSA
jgi:excisionase family DNA binding protein